MAESSVTPCNNMTVSSNNYESNQSTPAVCCTCRALSLTEIVLNRAVCVCVQLKPYLSPHGEKVENYATSHHDVLVVMQAEGYVPPEQRVKMPDMEDGDKLGFPKKKTLEQQKDEATKAMPMSIYENEVARCKYLNTPFRER